MKLLAIESSCDETAAAVIQDGRILSNVVASQIRLHTQYGGVVPELAAREHLANLVPVVQQSLAEAEIRADDLDWVSATQGPGLPPALMVGYQAAQH
ncbi:MAG: tRNA (adenosine(37)-N6)-threonylcarbamoyltransferase complex transferase subunit TsaD, partial [Verrucomicrobiota bacterium]